MNKAFVREPEDDGRASCPRCGAYGAPVGAAALETHLRPEALERFVDGGWFCAATRCEVAYFNQFAGVATVEELQAPVWPFDLDAPLCACFGFRYDDIEADVRDGTPVRIRALLARSQSSEARCATLAADGQCCLKEVQRLYLKLRGAV